MSVAQPRYPWGSVVLGLSEYRMLVERAERAERDLAMWVALAANGTIGIKGEKTRKPKAV